MTGPAAPKVMAAPQQVVFASLKGASLAFASEGGGIAIWHALMGVSVQRVQRGVSPSAMNMYAASRPLARRARHSERSEESRYSTHMRQSVVNNGLREGACVTLSSPPPTRHPERQHLPIVTQKLVNTSQRGAGSRKPTTPSLSHCPTSTRIHQHTMASLKGEIP